MYLDFDVKRFEKYSSYGTSHLYFIEMENGNDEVTEPEDDDEGMQCCIGNVNFSRRWRDCSDMNILQRHGLEEKFLFSTERQNVTGNKRVHVNICDVLQVKKCFSKRSTSKFRYILNLNYDVKRFEKYSFSYGTSQIFDLLMKYLLIRNDLK